MPYEWNKELYADILKSISEIPEPTANVVRCITEDKYKHLVVDAEEEYFTHPDGPYEGTKFDLKRDKEYTGKRLVRHVQAVKFYGKVLQQAIDDVAAAGGGQVIVPRGKFFVGAIVLRSGVDLHLCEGSKLHFMRNKTNEYYPVRLSRWEGVECMNFSPFIYADGGENISITGFGTLDGAADEFNWMPWKFGYFGETDQKIQREKLFEYSSKGTPVEERVFDDQVSTLRPPFIQFYHCKNVRIENITIKNSPFWEINPVLCENVLIRGVQIATDLYNNDGVDPESSKNVLIDSCYFLTGDDCIAIKSGRNEDGRHIGVPSENIIIRRNRFANGHGGITTGSEISGGVRNVFADGNFFDSQNLDYPIRFKTNAMRGGRLENIYVRNSVVNKSRVAVVHADFYYEEGHEGEFLPLLQNVTLDGFSTAEGGSIDAEHALYMKGFPDAPIRNVTLRNMDLSGVNGEAVLRNVADLTLDNVTINGRKLADGTFSFNDNGERA